MPELKVGAKVLHHGHFHTITTIVNRGVVVRDKDGKESAGLMKVMTFENERYKVKTADLEDFTWSEDDQAFYGNGRLLSQDERCVMEAITGTRPPAENHFAARAMLDAVDLASVSKAKLGEVTQRRKLAAKNLKGKDLAEYVTKVLAHCAELRKIRGG